MTKSYRHADSGHWLRDLLLLTVLVGALFGYSLGNRALWQPDEGRYAEIPREMVETGDYITPRLNGVKYFEKPALFYWLQASAIKVFGLNEWSLRLWTALFALFGCLAVYVAGRRFYGRHAGWFAAGILATNPLYGLLSGVITLDMTVSVLLTMALLSFLVGVRESDPAARRWWLWAFYALAALATLTKGLIGIVIPGMVIGAWIVLLWDWRLLRTIYLPTGLLLFLIIAVPWHLLVARANPEFTHFYFIHEHFERYLTKVHQRYQPAWFFIPVLIAGFYPWTAFLPQVIRSALINTWRDRRQHRDTWFLALWAILVFVFFSLSSSKLIPYILPVIPPLALLTGRYIASAWEQAALPRGRRVLWILGTIGIVLSVALLIIPFRMPDHPKVIAATELLGPNFYAMAAGLLVAGIAPLVVSYFSDTRKTIASLFAVSILMLVVVNSGMPKLDASRSVKSLALLLKPRLHVNDQIISYHAYYQDLPVYLQRRITVVGSKGELEFGTQVEDTSAWMIDDAALARRLRNGTAYIFVDRSNVEAIKASGAHLIEIGSSGNNVLLTNKEQAQ